MAEQKVRFPQTPELQGAQPHVAREVLYKIRGFPYHGDEVSKMTLGENLRLLRREKGLSQEQVAQTLFVARQTISKWENGQAEPGVESLKALAKLYGVSLDRLVGAESSSVPESHQPDMKRAELADWYWMLVLGFGINAAVWLLFLAAAFSRTGIPLALLALVAGIWRKTPGMWLVTQLLLVLEILWIVGGLFQIATLAALLGLVRCLVNVACLLALRQKRMRMRFHVA